VPSKQQQADSEIYEDQLLNFLVNRLDEGVSLNLANNAEIDTEDIYEDLAGATADGTSISTLYNSNEDSPSANTILYHLRTKFEPERLEQVANTLLRRDIVELLPDRVEVCANLHLRPYYDDEDDTDSLYHSEAKRGTTAFHAYATLRTREEQTLHSGGVAVFETATPPAVSSLSSSVFSTVLTPRSRPSTSIADSTIASVSRCFRRTTTPTWSRSSGGVRRFSRSSRKGGVASFNTT